MGHKTLKSSTPAKSDDLMAFCHDLRAPLDEVFNLIYVAAHKNVTADYSEHCLEVASQRLESIRKIVLGHCRSDGVSRKRAS
jgi:hypothetical protein